MKTHDLRDKTWSYVNQDNPDGVTTIISVPAYRFLGNGAYIIVGTAGAPARYRILSIYPRTAAYHLHCEYAPRTMAEVEADEFASSSQKRGVG